MDTFVYLLYGKIKENLEYKNSKDKCSSPISEFCDAPDIDNYSSTLYPNGICQKSKI